MAALKWGLGELNEGESKLLVAGQLRLRVRRRGDEWHLGREYAAPFPESESLEASLQTVDGDWPRDLEVGRWVTSAASEKISFLPVVPDRPVVVRPDRPVHLLPGRKIKFFLTVPAWIRVSALSGKSSPLAEFPTEVLSNTWFGDPARGELCYSLTTLARRELAAVPVESHMLTCPVVARNASSESLLFERICVRMPHLRSYQGDTRLWTNELKVTFKGMEDGSTVDYSTDPPSLEPGVSLLGEERVKQPRGQSLRSFTFLSTFGDLLGSHGGMG